MKFQTPSQFAEQMVTCYGSKDLAIKALERDLEHQTKSKRPNPKNLAVLNAAISHLKGHTPGQS